MNKDLFEIRIGEQLRNAEAPVPDGAWEAIQSAITTTPTPPPGTDGGSTSAGFGAGFTVGIAASAIILGSLAADSALKSNDDTNLNQPSANIEMPTEGNNLSEAQVANTVSFEEVEEPVEQLKRDEVSENQDESNVNTDAPAESESSNEVEREDLEDSQEENSPEGIASLSDASAQNSDATPATSDKSEPSEPAVSDSDASDNSSMTPVTSEPVKVAKAEIIANATTGYAPLTVQLANGGQAAECYWDLGSRGTSNTAQTDVKFEEPGRYTVSLTAYGANGETSYDQIEIEVKEGSDITLPNIFTPNGDGLNDVYTVGYAKNIDDFYLIITDENGRTIFETRDIKFEWGSSDTDFGEPNTRYFVTYMAMGVDGKKHVKAQMPLIIVKD